MKKISLYYFNPKNMENFGDVINPLIVSCLSGGEVVKKNMKYAKLVAIGSVLQNLAKEKPKLINKIHKIFLTDINVWGTGLIRPLTPHFFLRRKLKIHALRGKYTRAIMEEQTKQDFSNLTLGDPGLLASLLLEIVPSKKFKVGIIPHYVDHDNPAIETLKSLHPSSTIIPILGDPIQTLTKIAECEIILSSAMHGLIAADSLNIPNQWIRFSDDISGGNFKYHDYYSVFDLKPDVWDVREKTITRDDILSIPNLYAIKPEQVEKVKNNLIESFPFNK